MFNDFYNLFTTELWFKLTILSVFGACIGSFINVVAYRFPINLKAEWINQSAEFLKECGFKTNAKTSKVDSYFMKPSHCTTCKNKIRFYHNIPIISYILLCGKCSFCKTKYSIRYMFIELITAILFATVGFLFSNLVVIFGLITLISFLVTLSLIDFDSFLLPDEFTIPLVWLGILFNLNGAISSNLYNSVVGAMVGYVGLWILFWTFKIIMKKDGMGYGDFKLFAAAGAWLGIQNITSVILISSITGLIYAIYVKSKKQEETKIPFGPFISIAITITAFYSQQISNFLWIGR